MIKASRVCQVQGHQSFSSSHICTFQGCNLGSRWACAECFAQQIHQIQCSYDESIIIQDINNPTQQQRQVRQKKIISRNIITYLSNTQVNIIQHLQNCQKDIDSDKFLFKIQQLVDNDFYFLNNDQITQIMNKSNQKQIQFNDQLLLSSARQLKEILQIIQSSEKIAALPSYEEAHQLQDICKQTRQLIILNHMPDSPEISRIKQYIATKPQFIPGLEFTDFLYPENPVKFPVFNFTEQYTEFLRIKSVELRQEPSLRTQYKFVNQMWESYLRQKSVFGAKIIDKEQYEWYRKYIKPLVPLHENLKTIYNQLGLTEWEQFIDYRYNILKQEINELSQM